MSDDAWGEGRWHKVVELWTTGETVWQDNDGNEETRPTRFGPPEDE